MVAYGKCKCGLTPSPADESRTFGGVEQWTDAC